MAPCSRTVVWSSLLLPALAAQQKIALGPSNVLDCFGMEPYLPSNATALLDEQQAAGDPANGAPGTAAVPWTTPWDAAYYNMSGQVDPFTIIRLPAVYSLTSIWLYRNWGTIDISLTAGPNPFQASPGGAWNLSNSNQGWVSFNATGGGVANVTHVVITFRAPSGNSALELVLYGTETGPLPSPPAPTQPLPPPPMRMLLGSNGFANAGMNNLTAVGTLREYQDWDWIEHVQDQNAFQPSWDVDFNLDTWYSNLVAANVAAHTCIQSTPAFMHNGTEKDWKPLTDAQLATPGAAWTAGSYVRVADHAFQVAARYGSVAVPASQLKLAAGQPAVSGAGTLKYLEWFNEADGTWHGDRNGFFASYEAAAMMSAAYDGHGGTMGPGMGFKTADPSIRVAMFGVAGLKPDYLEGMRLWGLYNRADGRFPADVINVHVYAQNEAKTVGISPEDFNLAGRLQDICAWRNAAGLDAEVWLSEFGYDTDPRSPQAAPSIGAADSNATQASWLIRSVLAIASTACISRAHQYMLADVQTGTPWVYSTSGLLNNPGYAPKVSWYFYSTYINHLGQHAFRSNMSIPASPSGVALRAMCFANSTSQAIVAWSPTSNATVITSYSLPLAGCLYGVTSVTVVTPVDGSTTGDSVTLPVTAGAVTLNVTETPVILLPV